MTRKNKTRILSLALAVLLCTSGLITGGSLTASAADIQSGLPAIKLSTPSTFDPTVVAFGGKEWVVIGYNGTGVNSQTGSPYDKSMFDDTIPYSNHYEGSDLQTAMNNAATALPAGEQALIVPVSLEGGSGYYMQLGYDGNKVAGTDVDNQLF